MKKKHRKLVEVEWQDAAQHRGWHKPNQLATVAQCRTIGYLIDDLKSHVVVAMSSEVTGDYGDAMAIPRGCVVKITTLVPKQTA